MSAGSNTAEVGAVVVTPGEILAEMDTIDAAIKQLDVQAGAVPVSVVFSTGWKAFVAEWRQFYQEHKSITGRIWTEVYRQTHAYHRRVEEWYGAFAREGWQVRSALPPEKSLVQRAPDGDDSYSLRTMAWVAAAAALVSGVLVYGSSKEE